MYNFFGKLARKLQFETRSGIPQNETKGLYFRVVVEGAEYLFKYPWSFGRKPNIKFSLVKKPSLLNKSVYLAICVLQMLTLFTGAINVIVNV